MIDPASALPQRPVILLVEDEAAVRRSLQLVLQGNGYDVRSYGTGAALLADSRSASAAMLVADYQLPDSDGLTILRALKAGGFGGRAILVTGYGSPELKMSALAAGFSCVLEKPLGDRVVSDALVSLAH